jgi:phosphoribosylformylglycinamidine (FGAM) synthase-like enzyme
MKTNCVRRAGKRTDRRGSGLRSSKSKDKSQSAHRNTAKQSTKHKEQDFSADLLVCLYPDLASKEWVYRQYDHMVRTNTVVLPGADAAWSNQGNAQGLAIALDFPADDTARRITEGKADTAEAAQRRLRAQTNRDHELSQLCLARAAGRRGRFPGVSTAWPTPAPFDLP